jgi:hypothetical protein
MKVGVDRLTFLDILYPLSLLSLSIVIYVYKNTYFFCHIYVKYIVLVLVELLLLSFKMPHQFSTTEYADIIFVYGFCNGNGRAASREYRRRFPNRRTPSHPTFGSVFNYLRENGTFPSGTTERHVDEAQEDDIMDAVTMNPTISTRQVSRELNVTQSKVSRVLQKNNLYPYHIQMVQRLHAGDEIDRLEFCRWINNNRPTLYRTLFTDEAQFTRDGINNSRNSHVWAEENPHAIRERRSQLRFSVNVWIGVINNQLVGPHFFDGPLTGQVYLNFLQNILPNLLANANVAIRGMYFQHDGAPPHFLLAVRQHLNNVYGNRWIGRAGPISWPSRSPDFNPVDYHIWGRLKQLVYAVNINNRQQLIDRIIHCCNTIRNDPQSIRNSIRQLTIRQQKCVQAAGFHFENLF